MNSLALRNQADIRGVNVIHLWRRHFLGAELIASFLVVGLIAFAIELGHHEQAIHKLLSGSRSALYTTIAAICGSILGFALAGVSIMIAFFENSKLDRVRQSPYYVQVYRVYVSTIKYLALTIGICLLSVVLDRDADPSGLLEYAVFWSIVISCLRVGRCVWVLDRIIDIITTPLDPF